MRVLHEAEKDMGKEWTIRLFIRNDSPSDGNATTQTLLLDPVSHPRLVVPSNSKLALVSYKLSVTNAWQLNDPYEVLSRLFNSF